MTPRAVFDCMVYLQGAGSPNGPSAACLELASTGRLTLVVSDAILAEVRNVLSRPKTRKRFSGLTDESLVEFLAKLGRYAVHLVDAPGVVRLARDTKDEKYLNLAIAANATYLVSRDNDLLDLMTGDNADALAFRALAPAVRIVEPVMFLRSLTAAEDA